MEPVRYEWDEAKRVENLEKHGIDFFAAYGFDWTTAVVFEDSRQDYGEARYTAYGRVRGRVHALVFTDRAGVRRIISFRKANRREQTAYAAGIPGR
jgi:uncharacterized DUF497 family protein